MARNLDEPGANFNQLLELSIKLENARTFAGKDIPPWERENYIDPADDVIDEEATIKVADASTEMEQYPDTYLRPGETLEDWTGHYFRKPNAAGGRIYGKYAQQLASGGRVGLGEGTSKSDIAKTFAKAAFTPQTFLPFFGGQSMDWLLTPENVDKAGAWAKKNVKLIEKLTQNKLLPSSVRLYLRSISGSKTKITEDFFSESELKEIKKRVTEAEVSKALSGFATAGGGSMGRAIEGHSGIGYESDKPKTIKNAFTHPDVNIDMTFGQAGFYRNKDGSYQVYDKHNFSNMLGQWDWYAKGEDIVNQVWALDELYATDTVAGKIMRRYDLNEPNREVLAKVIEAYKNKEISLAKLIRTVGGYLASDETRDVVKKGTDYKGEEYEYVEKVETEGTGVPISLNIGPISQKEKYEVDKKEGFGKYDENWDAQMKGEYAKASTMGQEYAQMIFDDARTYPKAALGHPSGKSTAKLSHTLASDEYEDVGIPSEIRMEAQKYIKKREIDELDPNWQNVRMKDNWYWDKDKKRWMDLYTHPDVAEGVPYIPFWDETLKAQEYQERGKPHHPDYDLVPYWESESTGEDMYPGFQKREYKEFNKGGRIGYDKGDIVPKAKPKDYAGTLKMLLSKEAWNTLDPRTWTNLTYDFAKKAREAGQISDKTYQSLMMPLFGKTGEKITEAISRHDEFDEGGRVGLQRGGNYNPLGINQYTGQMKTIEEIQKIINQYPDNWTAKDFRGEGKLNNPKLKDYKGVILNKKELARAQLKGVEPKFKGKRTFKEPNFENIKRTKKIKVAQGSNISIRGSGQVGKQFSHIYPIIESVKQTTKMTSPIMAKMNRALEGFNRIGQELAEKQEILAKTKPKNYKTQIVKLNSLAKLNVNSAIETLGKDFKGKIGYYQLNPDTLEFKPKAGNWKGTFGGIKGKEETFLEMGGKGRKKFERKISEEFGKKTLKKSALKGAAKALRFVPGLGIAATLGFGAYGLYDAIKKGYTDPGELLASAAWGSGVEFKDKEEKKKEGIASLKV